MPLIVPRAWDTESLAPGDVSRHIFRSASALYTASTSWSTVSGMTASITLEEQADVWQLYWCAISTGDNNQIRLRLNGQAAPMTFHASSVTPDDQGHMMQWIWKQVPAGTHTFDIQQLRGSTTSRAMGLIVLSR